MAIEIKNGFVVSIGSLVESSLNAALTVKSKESAEKEAAFQNAVSEGKMSYEAQIKFREEQLAAERLSSISDPDFVARIENSIATTKKLARFEKIRIKYSRSLDAYVQGKKSLKNHISVLQNLMGRETNPELQEELRTEMSNLTKTQAENEVIAVENRALAAQRDLSIPLIEKSISEIHDRRAKDSLNGNEEAVKAWDETLNSLNTKKSSLLIQNATNDITYQVNRNNLKSHQQVELIDRVASSADAVTPFTYDGVQYSSLQDYWVRQRDTVINSPDFWNSLESEIEAETSRIAALSPSAQVPVSRIKEVDNFYNSLKTRAGFENYADRIEQERTKVLDSSVNELASFIEQEASVTEDYATAEKAAKELERTFGIKLTRVPGVGEKTFAETTTEETKKVQEMPSIRQFTAKETSDLKAAQSRLDAGIASETDQKNLDYAKKQGWSTSTVAKTEPTPALPSITSTPARQFTSKETSDLAAAKARVDAGTGSVTDKANVEYATKQGWTPTVAPTPVKVAPTATVTPAPTQTPAPKPAGSVVDYLASKKMDSSFTSRQALAKQYGMNDYSGTAEQNLTLLEKLQTL